MTKIPQTLIDRFATLCDDFEDHIRADERQRLLERFRAEFPDLPVAKPAPVPMTGLHGEPLHESGPQPKTLSRTHRAMIDWLSRGTFMAVPTLAGHLGIKKQSVYTYLSDLRANGYPLEIRETGNYKGGYYKIYRLAKAS
jgi:biotin operon repressor